MSIPNFFRFLTDDGASSGDNDMAVNGVVTPVKFWVAHATRTLLIRRMIVHITDAGTVTALTYGAVAALANGVLIKVLDSDAAEDDLLDGSAITGNQCWTHYAYDVDELAFSGGANKSIRVRWTFGKSGMYLPVEPGGKFEVTIQDDLTGLVDHHISVQGIYADQLGGPYGQAI